MAIEEAERRIGFVYLAKNVTHGTQQIRFSEIPGKDGRMATLIRHETRYRSGHVFRDKCLYPSIHARIIDSFHKGILRRAGIPFRTRRAELPVETDIAGSLCLEIEDR